MYRKDFLLRQINELIRFLVDLILYSTHLPPRQEEQTLKQAYSATGIDRKELLSLSQQELVDILKEKDLGMEKLELAAYVLLKESEKETDLQERELLRKKVKDMLSFVDQNSGVYSFERKSMLDNLSD